MVNGVAKSRTRLSDFTFHFSLSCIGEGNGNPLQCSCLENPRDRGAWWAAVYGATQCRTRLNRLSSSSSSIFFVWVVYLEHTSAGLSRRCLLEGNKLQNIMEYLGTRLGCYKDMIHIDTEKCPIPP